VNRENEAGNVARRRDIPDFWIGNILRFSAIGASGWGDASILEGNMRFANAWDIADTAIFNQIVGTHGSCVRVTD
jgi:hypothetical protein